MRDTSFVFAPIRDHAFFKQAVLEGQVGNALLQCTSLAAQLGDTVIAAQAAEHDTDLVLGREMPACLPPDILHHPLCRGLYRLFF